MPRFENEGFRTNSNNDIDRTVPAEENYYGAPDLDFNNRQRDEVRENYAEPEQKFQSESFEDFNTGRDRVTKSNNNKPDKGKKKKPPKAIIALVIIIVLIIAILGSVFSVFGRINYDEKKDNPYISADRLRSDKAVKNILLLGVDARSGEEAEASRSDAMMLVTLDSKHHCIKTTSFLRDTWVYIPSLDYEQRLNAACSGGGYQNVINTIEYNFGVAIDGYVVADFEMFKILVDSIGGVTVNVTKQEAREVTKHPKRYGNVTLHKGENELTGEQALAYCRIRKIDTDFERTKRQRTVIKAILDKAKTSPLKLYKMAYNSAPYIETNLSKSELSALIGKAGLCISGDYCQEKVPFDGTWDYATINGNSVIAINREKNRDMLIDYIYEQSPEDLNAEE